MSDQFTRRAKAQGYRARSVFKLKALNKRFHFLKPGRSVLDIGCWPGSWLQYAKTEVMEGVVLGVDIKRINPIKGVEFMQKDAFDENLISAVKGHAYPFDVILSDIAPHTTGNKMIDASRSSALGEQVLNIANEVLREDGIMVLKVFQSNDANELFKEIQKCFRSVKWVKPEGSKGKSKEMYIVGIGFKYKASRIFI